MNAFASEYALGDVVYLRVTNEPRAGMVVCVKFSPGGADATSYLVTWANADTSEHYGMELAREFTPNYGD